MRRLAYCSRRSFTPRRYERTRTPDRILFEGAFACRKELYDLRSRVLGNNPLHKAMATLHLWIAARNNNFHRPPKPHLFPATTEADTTTSAMGHRTHGIRYKVKA